MGIVTATPHGTMPADAADNADAAKPAAGREPVNEQRSRSVGPRKIALQHRNVERQACRLRASGLFRTTTASSIAEPSLFSTDIVALGGSLAKLSFPSSHCLMKSAVSTCPAALTGRSAKMMELGAMPLIVSFPPSSFAPPELRTASDGTIFVWFEPIVFCAGAVIASWASANSDAHSRLATADHDAGSVSHCHSAYSSHSSFTNCNDSADPPEGHCP